MKDYFTYVDIFATLATIIGEDADISIDHYWAILHLRILILAYARQDLRVLRRLFRIYATALSEY